MTRQRNSMATRRAIFDDHGGEMRFWLGWVHGEIAGPVQDWFRTQARHDPALQQDLDSIDAPAARRDVRHALETTNYLTPKVPAPAGPRPSLADDLDDVTNLVLQERSATRQPAPAKDTFTPVAQSSPPRPVRSRHRQDARHRLRPVPGAGRRRPAEPRPSASPRPVDR